MRHSTSEHPSTDTLEAFTLGKLTERYLARVEKHLRGCRRCRGEVGEIDAFIRALRAAARDLALLPLDITHQTEDGPIRLWVTRTAQGDWEARFAGRELEGLRKFDRIDNAIHDVLVSFRQMFPEHRCDGRCCGASPRQ